MYGRRLLVMVLLSAVIHLVAPYVIPRQPHSDPKPRKVPAKPVPVSVFKQQAKAIEQQQKAEAAKPKPEPPKEPPKPRPEAPKPPPREAPPPPKPETPPPTPEPPAPKKPAPLVLSNVALNGGVAVQTGQASNLFGDPTVDAAGYKKGSDAPRGPEVGTGGGGEAPARKVVVKPPEALNNVKGVYPEQHRELNRVVRVELMLAVNPAGEVVDVSVRRGDLPAFDEEAKRTAKRLRFRPATRDGVPIPYEVKWTVVFLPEA